MATLEVELFPDSGHHYYFVPLAFASGTSTQVRQSFETVHKSKLPTLDASQEKALIAKAEREAGLWQTAAGEFMLWLRYCYGRRDYPPQREKGFLGARTYGLWLAIETNTGASERGFTWEVDDFPPDDHAGFAAHRAAIERRETPPTPYAAYGASDLFDEFWQTKEFDLAYHCRLKDDFKINSAVPLRIVWRSPSAGDPVPVHLIVDFGNSRTAVVGLEHARNMAGIADLSRVCRPILFANPLEDARLIDHHAHNAAGIVPQSWFILREPTFQQRAFDPSRQTQDTFVEGTREEVSETIQGTFFKKKVRTTVSYRTLERVIRRLPQMFVEQSPAVIGQEALRILANADHDRLGLAFLSSPKRYSWDTDRVGTQGETFWHMQPGAERAVTDRASTKLAGDMLLFFPRGDRSGYLGSPLQCFPPLDLDNAEERPVRSPERPDYPRADSLVWVALSIIETSWRQINSEAWREGNSPLLNRFLRSIVVTFPPGWTRKERDAFYNAWRLARNIFYWSRFPYWEEQGAGVQVPEIKMAADEAISSQLPIMFADIHHMGDSGRAWIDLYGRVRTVDGRSVRTVRALTIDIGGGTTDTAVVEYIDKGTRDLGGAHLEPSVLFSDSSSVAGDKLILDIIEKVLLPKLAEEFAGDPAKLSAFERALNSRQGQHTARIKRSILLRSVFFPMAIQWLEDFKFNRRMNPETGFAWRPNECAGELAKDVIPMLAEFNAIFRQAGLVDKDLMVAEEPFSVDYDRIDRVVREWVTPLADTYARFVSAFDCDLVIVTGKPSELPQVRDVLSQRLPIEEHRLVFAHKYHAGSWFPGAPDGVIHDAKMVTVVGAALYEAMSIGFIPNWQLERRNIEDRQPPARNYWGRHDGNTLSRPLRVDGVYLRPGDNEAVVPMGDQYMVGRARFLQIAPEPVYIFRWRRERFPGGFPPPVVNATLRRVTHDDNGHALPVEHIVLVSVEGTIEEGGRKRAVTLDDVELKLQTLPNNGEHWLDSGVFRVGKMGATP